MKVLEFKYPTKRTTIKENERRASRGPAPSSYAQATRKTSPWQEGKEQEAAMKAEKSSRHRHGFKVGGMVLVLGLTRRSEGDPTHAEVHMIRRFGMAGIDQRTYVGKRLDGSTEKGTEGFGCSTRKPKPVLGNLRSTSGGTDRYMNRHATMRDPCETSRTAAYRSFSHFSCSESKLKSIFAAFSKLISPYSLSLSLLTIQLLSSLPCRAMAP